jgi:hypothetical protein
MHTHLLLMLQTSTTDTIATILSLLSTPVLVPLAVSGVTWLVDKYTTLTEGMNVWLKRTLIVVIPVALTFAINFVSTKVGYTLDLSSVTAAGGSIVAMIIYAIGKKKSA